MGGGGLLLGVSLKFDMQNSKLRLHADDTTVSTLTNPHAQTRAQRQSVPKLC